MCLFTDDCHEENWWQGTQVSSVSADVPKETECARLCLNVSRREISVSSPRGVAEKLRLAGVGGLAYRRGSVLVRVP